MIKLSTIISEIKMVGRVTPEEVKKLNNYLWDTTNYTSLNDDFRNLREKYKEKLRKIAHEKIPGFGPYSLEVLK